MDLKLFGSVVRRHKVVILGGFVLAFVLAIFSYGQPTFANGKPTVVPRGIEIWQSQAQLLITQQNDPYGNAVQGLPLPNGKPSAHNPPLQLGGVGYMAALAPIYASMANGDLVQTAIHKIAPTVRVVAIAAPDPTSGVTLPVVQLTTTGTSRALVQKVANFAANTLEGYVVSEQEASGVPAVQRVKLSHVQDGLQTKLIKGQKPTVPMMVFVAVMAAAITLAFILENFRVRGADETADPSAVANGKTLSREPIVVAPAAGAASAEAPPMLDLRYRQPTG